MLDARPALTSRSLALRVLLVIAGSLLMALSAKIVVPLAPVPITGQTLALPLVVALLGRNGSVFAMLAYLAEGFSGLPVFASAGLLGPTAGYLLSYPIVAFAIGALYETRLGARYAGRLAVDFLEGAFILVAGATWLGIALHLAPQAAAAVGIFPFIAGDALKCALAASLGPTWPSIAKRLRIG